MVRVISVVVVVLVVVEVVVAVVVVVVDSEIKNLILILQRMNE